MKRIFEHFGGNRILITLGTFGLIAALAVIPGYLHIASASVSNGTVDGKTESHEPGLENFDIRTQKNDHSADLMDSFRAGASVSAPKRADMLDELVRGEEKLRSTVKSLKVEYSPDLRVPEVISPSVAGDNFERLSGPSRGKRSEVLRSFLKQNNDLIGLTTDQIDELIVTADYENPAGNMSFAHLEQQIDGVPVFRGEVKAGFAKNGSIVRIINNLAPFVSIDNLSRNFGDPELAVRLAAENVGQQIDLVGRMPFNRKESTDLKAVFGRGDGATTAEKMYFPTELGVARPAWRVLVWKTVNAYYVIVDAETGAVLWRKNLTEDQTQTATYSVYYNPNAYIKLADSPAPVSPGPIDPSLGTQGAFLTRTDVTIIGNEFPNTFNDLGWITDGNNTTDGNNVQAGLDRELPATGNPANPADIDPTGMATGSPSRVFSYAYNPMNPNTSTGDAPTPNTPTTCTATGTNAAPTAYQQGVTAQLFYTTNLYHDAMYRLGFNEAARNFQNNNFGRGGVGADRVSAQSQDCAGTDNANFTTPADGTRGTMQMFIFDDPTPDSDGSLDNDVVIHELTHGTSNRLHSNASGLTNNMSRGMGEGWSDFYGLSMLSEATDPINGVYSAGAYVTWNSFGLGTTNSYYGIRRFPKAVMAFTGGPNNRPHNPLTFGDLNSGCSLTDGAFAPAFTGTCDQVHNAGEIWSSALWEVRALMVTRLGFQDGTTRVLQVVTDGMKLAPANPTFVQERDAILSAASALSFAPEASADVRDVWEGFRIRGLGFSARVTTASPAVVVEAFDAPNVRHIDPFSVSDAPGDGDGFPEPNENVVLSVPVTNNTGSTITNVQVNLNGGPNVSYGTMTDGQTITNNIPYTVPFSALCGSVHQVNVNVSSSVGTNAPVVRSFTLGNPSGGAPATFSNNTLVNLPGGQPTTTSGPASPYPSDIAVSGLSGSKAMTLNLLGITHTFPGDLDFLLVGPGGQKYIFASDSGGSGPVTNLNISFADSAASQPSTSQWVAGTFRPYNSGANDPFVAPAPAGPYTNAAPAGTDTFTSVFGTNGANMNGTWSLYIVDAATGDFGTLAGWSLTFTSTDFSCNVPGSAVSVSGRVVTTGGRGIAKAFVTMSGTAGTFVVQTNSFGYFTFPAVPSGSQYSVTPSAKRYTFTPQNITPNANVTGLNFVGS